MNSSPKKDKPIKFIVCSGGQTGVDQAALEAAFLLSIPTGGWAPAGYRTLSGKQPEILSDLYGLKEHPSYSYSERTKANVRDSIGTIRIAKNWNSPGEKCTMKWIKYYDRPYIDIDFNSDPRDNIPRAANWILGLCNENIPVAINFAGNSETSCPGIQSWSFHFLTETFIRVFNYV